MIRKVVIPAAGLGTRFLPATKAQPKEMLPIIDKPTIQYIVEEAVASGARDIMIISGRGKRAIEDHFDKSFELEETLRMKGQDQLLDEVRGISELANIFYIRQKEAKGLGHAIACAKEFIGSEPFAVMLGDDVIRADVPVLKQMIDLYVDYQQPIIGVQEVEQQRVSDYGIASIEKQVQERLFATNGMVEKPLVNEAPSKYAIMGRYILPPDIFSILENLPPGSGGEIQLTDALNLLNNRQRILAYAFEGRRYDIGNKFNFIVATIEMALERPDLSDKLSAYLKSLVNSL
ncbi:UDP-glucose pyrophosphorylase [Scopulibacillus darangshiensis]|uniref:UTP--glucose-1-phosphate uridylyltransferase n=2 Tax=Scopulibacillus darangshiensis TaxID=442528 RepID=A0A4R2NWN0_9BACL|nr:UDP-glucose pyrophosphorylase [Scopulibacillus darangshiensis]